MTNGRERLFTTTLLLLASLFISRPLAAQEIVRTGVVEITVEEPMGPVDGLLIRSSGITATTDATGKARLTLPAGPQILSLTRIGYVPKRVPVTVVADSVVSVTITVDMEEMAAMLEDVKISATRTERLAGETPIRVEVVDEMEVDENTLMAPSGITMLLNETPGTPGAGGVSLARNRKRANSRAARPVHGDARRRTASLW